MVGLALRAELLVYKREVKSKDKGKGIFVEKYLDGRMKSSNYCDRVSYLYTLHANIPNPGDSCFESRGPMTHNESCPKSIR